MNNTPTSNNEYSQGQPGQPAQVFCPNCRGGNAPGAVTCQWCGNPLQATQAQPTQATQSQYSPPPSAAMPPPTTANVNAPKKSRPLWMTAIFVLVGVCLILGIITALLGPKTNTTTTAQPPAAAAVTEAPAAPAAAQSGPTDTAAPPAPTDTAVPPTEAPKQAGIGDTVEVGSWKVTVEKLATVKEFDWSGFGNMEIAKGTYVKVYATIENVTNKTASVNSFDWQIRDSGDARYTACTEVGCITLPAKESREWFNSDVPPRTKSKMLAMFDVATDAKDLVLGIEAKEKIVLGDLP